MVEKLEERLMELGSKLESPSSAKGVIHLIMVLLQPDPFLNELTSMFERSTETGSVWVTFKRSSLKSKVQRNKLKAAQQPIKYRCLTRVTNAKKTISTSQAKLLHVSLRLTILHHHQ
ncbi:Signal recognition particle 14 kDa protein [Hibiscus syriacus]|uniref:Signal recognition particle 14 kDa protein n=1 Tax=Hibiscus syriacus TaxID=106335 RepID=A0A6A2WMJ5_HIBSY|nr:signal recognition particle 14 kDa protein-like isoform X2 [Hibiscus syriacus]KAE8661482.1 Signal recognition particle 14 kDa protein [Hibiscus syriacus]